nr:hypothetical protein Iba_scaffold458296CG0010 [Ipomoea batatas]
MPKNTLIAVSAHVSPPPPGFGLVGLQNIQIQQRQRHMRTEICKLNEIAIDGINNSTLQMQTAKQVRGAFLSKDSEPKDDPSRVIQQAKTVNFCGKGWPSYYQGVVHRRPLFPHHALQKSFLQRIQMPSQLLRKAIFVSNEAFYDLTEDDKNFSSSGEGFEGSGSMMVRSHVAVDIVAVPQLSRVGVDEEAIFISLIERNGIRGKSSEKLEMKIVSE